MLRRSLGELPEDKHIRRGLRTRILSGKFKVHQPWVERSRNYVEWLKGQPKPTTREYWVITNIFGDDITIWSPNTVTIATASMAALITAQGRRADPTLPMGVSRTVTGSFIAHYHEMFEPRRSPVFTDEMACHFDWLKNRISVIDTILQDNLHSPILVKWAQAKMARMQDCLDRRVICKER